LQFTFDEYKTNVFFSSKVPDFTQISEDLKKNSPETSAGNIRALLIADENTKYIADLINKDKNLPICLLKSGENNKNWQSIEEILSAAHRAQLGRDCVFIAAGGGVIGDLTGFAASIYKRGCRFVLVSTTLLGMVDASVGGKTGFDLFEIKNLAGTFYPANSVYMPQDTLLTLPQKEWKSGFAELIKTAVLETSDNFLDQISDIIKEQGTKNIDICSLFSLNSSLLQKLIERAVLFKGSVVSEDMRESGKRMILNLGHTFGHALESVMGLGAQSEFAISHGEAVAWGIVRACELGTYLGITPNNRAEKIINIIESFGYNITLPLADNKNVHDLLNAMKSDKKNKKNKLTFIVPDKNSAQIVELESENKQLEIIISKGLA